MPPDPDILTKNKRESTTSFILATFSQLLGLSFQSFALR